MGHTVEFLAFGIPVSLAFIFWWGKPHGLLSRVPPAFLLCVFASLFDQTHKLFVPGREFDAGDLLFDLLGYSIAISLIIVGGIAFKLVFLYERRLWLK